MARKPLGAISKATIALTSNIFSSFYKQSVYFLLDLGLAPLAIVLSKQLTEVIPCFFFPTNSPTFPLYSFMYFNICSLLNLVLVVAILDVCRGLRNRT
jgi:hypothetical protein